MHVLGEYILLYQTQRESLKNKFEKKDQLIQDKKKHYRYKCCSVVCTQYTEPLYKYDDILLTSVREQAKFLLAKVHHSSYCGDTILNYFSNVLQSSKNPISPRRW